MPQGSLKSKKKAPKVVVHGKKRHGKVKKGNPTKFSSKKAGNYAYKDNKAISRAINKKNEQATAAKALQSGAHLNITDVKTSGKELVKEIRRNMLKKKSSRIEEKLEKAKAKLDREDMDTR
eukprot:CAMPEP_0113936266 /NCGR_PEP_ID=MMETSP1339-20121228/3218_1 /TAXON_ID=94617 /ORGANISM="Fibrocapsa japonica" /LENGTH=120 /DNA_ID=CAMNT_0000938677 /DNA_START=31 /DNA_END=393 /DNA_ORIENTATION=+ /assembly_acc=CAM_ASM_000762